MALSAAAQRAVPKPLSVPTASPPAAAVSPMYQQMPQLPLPYGAAPPQTHMQQYDHMAPPPYYIGSPYPMPTVETPAGGATRVPRRCWRCGLRGHLRRSCATHPPATAQPPLQDGRPARPMMGLMPTVPTMPVMGAARAGGLPPHGYVLPWGLPRQARAPPAGAPHYAQAAAAMGQPCPSAPPDEQLSRAPATPPGAGGLPLMAVGTGSPSTINDADWIIDSGASHHMAPTTDKLSNLRSTELFASRWPGGRPCRPTMRATP